MAKLSNKTIAEQVLIEGLDHAILKYYGKKGAGRFADVELQGYWISAYVALEKILKKLNLEDSY